MRNEVTSAVDFLTKIIHIRGSGVLEIFKENLSDILCEHYQNHWFPEKPFKGSGYRCIRISNNKMDPLVSKAGASCGMTERQLLQILPRELTMWVDPEEVSYRIGEEGSIGVLYDGATEPEPTTNLRSTTSTPELDTRNTNTNNHNVLQSNGHIHHQQEYIVPTTTQSHISQDNFFQTCKDQLRNVYIPGMASDATHGVGMEYFATYVAS